MYLTKEQRQEIRDRYTRYEPATGDQIKMHIHADAADERIERLESLLRECAATMTYVDRLFEIKSEAIVGMLAKLKEAGITE